MGQDKIIETKDKLEGIIKEKSLLNKKENKVCRNKFKNYAGSTYRNIKMFLRDIKRPKLMQESTLFLENCSFIEVENLPTSSYK